MQGPVGRALLESVRGIIWPFVPVWTHKARFGPASPYRANVLRQRILSPAHLPRTCAWMRDDLDGFVAREPSCSTGFVRHVQTWLNASAGRPQPMRDIFWQAGSLFGVGPRKPLNRDQRGIIKQRLRILRLRHHITALHEQVGLEISTTFRFRRPARSFTGDDRSPCWLLYTYGLHRTASLPWAEAAGLASQIDPGQWTAGPTDLKCLLLPASDAGPRRISLRPQLLPRRQS